VPAPAVNRTELIEIEEADRVPSVPSLRCRDRQSEEALESVAPDESGQWIVAFLDCHRAPHLAQCRLPPSRLSVVERDLSPRELGLVAKIDRGSDCYRQVRRRTAPGRFYALASVRFVPNRRAHAKCVAGALAFCGEWAQV
jgi:hypothetical protein